MDESQAALLGEQMKHALDLMCADLEALQTSLKYSNEMDAHRLKTLEARVDDHELRLRQAMEGVTQFKLWIGLASGSAGLAALAAVVRTLAGGG